MPYARDPTIPERDSRKKVVFFCDKDKHIEFVSRLKLDGFNQAQFYRMMIDGYLNEDAAIIRFVELFKEKWVVQGKKKRDTVSRMRKKASQVRREFSLDDTDIESIFDTIEKETGL